MRIKHNYRDKYFWHDWFAWYPVRCSEKGEDIYTVSLGYYYWVWFEKIERKAYSGREGLTWVRRLKGE